MLALERKNEWTGFTLVLQNCASWQLRGEKSWAAASRDVIFYIAVICGRPAVQAWIRLTIVGGLFWVGPRAQDVRWWFWFMSWGSGILRPGANIWLSVIDESADHWTASTAARMWQKQPLLPWAFRFQIFSQSFLQSRHTKFRTVSHKALYNFFSSRTFVTGNSVYSLVSTVNVLSGIGCISTSRYAFMMIYCRPK